MRQQILDLNPESYQKHSIHNGDRDWAETNCYVDLWIEQLHALGLEPLAAMPFTLAIDFEGDQWTFFKFPLEDLYQLYGISVKELNIWRNLTQHITEQVGKGRPVLVELDSMYLPDTAGTAYQREHVKTTVSVNVIDMDAQYLGYFHNQGYFELSGENFVNIFRINDKDTSHLPPYVEYAKLETRKQLNQQQLVQESLNLLAKHVARMPEKNPFQAFKERLSADADWLMTEDIELFHQYSFATVRQCGACFELSKNYFEWLSTIDINGNTQYSSLIDNFANLSAGAKALQFQLARSMNRKKPLALDALDTMAATWQSNREMLTQYIGALSK